MVTKHLVVAGARMIKNMKLNPNRDVHSSFSEGVHLSKTNKQTYTFLKPSKTFKTMCTGNKSIGS